MKQDLNIENYLFFPSKQFFSTPEHRQRPFNIKYAINNIPRTINTDRNNCAEMFFINKLFEFTKPYVTGIIQYCAEMICFYEWLYITI